jgi:hypothetical protein
MKKFVVIAVLIMNYLHAEVYVVLNSKNDFSDYISAYEKVQGSDVLLLKDIKVNENIIVSIRPASKKQEHLAVVEVVKVNGLVLLNYDIVEFNEKGDVDKYVSEFLGSYIFKNEIEDAVYVRFKEDEFFKNQNIKVELIKSLKDNNVLITRPEYAIHFKTSILKAQKSKFEIFVDDSRGKVYVFRISDASEVVAIELSSANNLHTHLK